MPFDFKKEYKELYAPKAAPALVDVPPARYAAVRGRGDPNAENGVYQQAISVLYAVAYTLKMSYKTDYAIPGFLEYVVPPLEGFWWQEGVDGCEYSDKASFNWIAVLRLPDFVRPEDFDWAVATATRKKKLDCSRAEYLTLQEGLCVQALHVGPYETEPATIAAMDAWLDANGYETDINAERRHHEIYLTDPRRTPAEKWRTVIRHPVRKRRG